jgi:hypothetical protein
MMSGKPDLLREMNARTHAIVLLLFFLAVWVAALVLVLAVPGFPVWWACLWVAAASLTVIIIGATLGPLLVRGGAYRVVVQDDWLRVESPHHSLGPSFAVALSSVVRLVTGASYDGPDYYQVHTRTGQAFPLEHGFGEAVFEAIRRLHPEVPVERRK